MVLTEGIHLNMKPSYFLRGFSTVEVMVMMVAISMVVMATYGAEQVAFRQYREIIHRERAQMFLVETLEQLEAMRRTCLLKNYQTGWQEFLGKVSGGDYSFVVSSDQKDCGFRFDPPTSAFDDENENLVRVYQSEEGKTFFTRLERRVSVKELKPDQKLITVRIFWGSDSYSPDSFQQLSLESLYTDDRQPAFVL